MVLLWEGAASRSLSRYRSDTGFSEEVEELEFAEALGAIVAHGFELGFSSNTVSREELGGGRQGWLWFTSIPQWIEAVVA